MSHIRFDAAADVAAEFGTLESEPAPAVGEVVLGLVLLSACFLAPSTPPIMAAATTSARQIAKRIQKSRRRNPHILRGFGGGGLLSKSSMLLWWTSCGVKPPTIVVLGEVGESEAMRICICALSSKPTSFSLKYPYFWSRLSRERCSLKGFAGSSCLSVISLALVSNCKPS